MEQQPFSVKSSYFTSFDHNCSLSHKESIDKLTKWRSIDPKSRLTRRHYSSYSSIINNRKFHIEHHCSTIHPFSLLKTLWESIMILIYTLSLSFDPIHFLELLESTEEHSKWSYIHIINVIDIMLRLSIMGYWDKRKCQVSLSLSSFSFDSELYHFH